MGVGAAGLSTAAKTAVLSLQYLSLAFAPDPFLTFGDEPAEMRDAERLTGADGV